MRGFKIAMIFGLGTIFIFLLVMFLNRGGSPGIKHAKLQAEYSNIYNMQMINFASKGYYADNFEELLEYSTLPLTYYSFFLTPDSYLLSSEAELSRIPQKFRDLAYIGYTEFRIVAIGNIDSDSLYDVWTMDEKNRIFQIFDDDKDIAVK